MQGISVGFWLLFREVGAGREGFESLRRFPPAVMLPRAGARSVADLGACGTRLESLPESLPELLPVLLPAAEQQPAQLPDVGDDVGGSRLLELLA